MSTPLLLFTTSQSPLPIRYPHPHKPNLLLPPLIHRTLHNALDSESPSTHQSKGTIWIPHPESLVKHDIPNANANTPTDLPTPSLSSSPSLAGAVESEITVKIHLVSPATSTQHAQSVTQALDYLEKYKGLGKVDTLLIGWKGVDYRGKPTIASEFFGCGAEGLTNDAPPLKVTPELVEGIRQTWDRVVEGTEGRVGRVGSLYLPLELLQALSTDDSTTSAGGGSDGKKKVIPAINSMDTPDCHSLPKEYTQFARDHNIELWAGGGGEGSDPLPAAELHNLLNEFYTALPLSSDQEQKSTTSHIHALESAIPLREDRLKYDESTPRGVEVKWVLGYTLVSKTRNVVKDKGYIVSAAILP